MAEQIPDRSGSEGVDRASLVALGLILVATFLVYFPVTRNDFSFLDDFIFVAQAKRSGLSIKEMLRPLNSHVIPIYRGLLAVQYQCFGTRPAGYYWTSIAMHLGNVLLVWLFFRTLLNDRVASLLAAMLFAVSAAHTSPVTLILASNSALAGLWFLTSAIAFMKYLASGRTAWLAVALLGHVGSFFSFSYGLETPLLYLLLAVALRREGSWKTRAFAGMRAVWPFALNLLGLLLIRGYVLRRAGSGDFLKSSDVGSVLMFIPKSLRFFGGGIYEGFLKSYTGSYLPADLLAAIIPGLSSWAFPLVVISVLALMIGLVDWRDPKLRGDLPVILCLMVWLGVMYYLPILPRVVVGYDQGSGQSFKLDYHLFVLSDRYRYLPGMMAAGVFVMTLRRLRPMTQSITMRNGCLAAFALILLANAYRIRTDQRELYRSTREFHGTIETLMREVGKASEEGTKPIMILNEVFAFNSPVSRFVLPDILVELYAAPDIAKCVTFVRSAEVDRASPESFIYGIRESGNLYPLDRRQ